MKLLDRFKRKPRKVLLTGEDIINLRSDLDQLISLTNKVVIQDGVTLREDVNDALSATAKAIYKIEELEIRMSDAEHLIQVYCK